jgi:hypothetical protein
VTAHPPRNPIARIPLLEGTVFAVFVYCALGANPSVDWLDSGSLVGSAWTMGVAHPPGEPAWLALAKLAQLIPIGDIAFRTNLLSAACLAACAWPLLLACGRDADHPPSNAEAFLVFGPLIAFGARLQGVRAEVYAATALLLLVGLFAALRLRGARSSALLGLVLGLGAAVHPLLCAVAVPALLLARALSSPVRLRDAGWLVGAGLWGFSAYAWLPLRARAIPARSWGVPDDLQHFVDVILARTFSQNFGGEAGGGLIANLEVVGLAWSRAALPVLLLIGLAGCFRWRGRPVQPGSRALMAVTLLWVAGNAATILPQNKVFGTNPDLHGYLLIGALGAIPVAVLGVRNLGRMREVLVVLLFMGLVVDGTAAARHGNNGARTFAAAQAAGVPSGALLLPSGNDTAFVWGYLQAVERRRTDLVLLPRVLLGHEHERIRLGGDAGLRALAVPWSPRLQTDPVTALAGASRPLFIELREPEQPHLAGKRLRRHGLVAAPADWPTESAWLQDVRATTLDELALPRFRSDAQGQLVLQYHRVLWGDAL